MEQSDTTVYFCNFQNNAKEFDDGTDMLAMPLVSSPTKNPRSIIRFLRGSTYYYYDINTAYEYFIIHGNTTDPYTRQPIDTHEIKKIISYYDFYKEYPELEVTKDSTMILIDNIINKKQKVNSIARYTIVPNDVIEYFEKNINNGEKITRDIAIKYLSSYVSPELNIGRWLIRDSSVVSSEHGKVFVLSIYVSINKIVHSIYVHIYGRGIYNMDHNIVMPNYILPSNPLNIPIFPETYKETIADLIAELSI